MNPNPDGTDSLPTRVSLLGRLANLADDKSWREFFLTYEGHIRKVAQRRGLSEADAEEVAQDVLRRVAQTIRDYKRAPHRGAFRSWLFQLTRWRASDRLRRRAWDDPSLSAAMRETPGGRDATGDASGPVDRLASRPELEREFELEAQRHALDLLLARLESSVSQKHIQMFQMVMLDEVPVPRVAELFHTRPAAVYVVKHRVLEKLREEVAGMGPEKWKM
ncbi:MAG TPA: sigma-70 family RNA polymerase sigma factor [Opitutaceae bacterium]|nr:sigma-70 family RNA polymerase sigma factor [Opitutaceae bacterium]